VTVHVWPEAQVHPSAMPLALVVQAARFWVLEALQ
jgi:hypothetical protein